MDVVGSEIGQKMRSAIKAKLTELGCYVDDELPDYVMVMVANKRTRAQMEEDLQLFLGDNTVLFVNWLHQVLRKLQEVTVAPTVKSAEPLETSKDRSSSKDRKSKEKKDKSKEKHKKGDSSKKSKKKLKEKQRKKGEKKAHKKKKSKEKDTEIKRPNIPPLLMNMEKDSEPSITDVFAGQILKNHGITLESLKEEPNKIPDIKPSITELKRPILPIIDPATISSDPTAPEVETTAENASSSQDNDDVVTIIEPMVTESEPMTEGAQLQEINEIEAKIQGLKQKLAEQLDSMSDDDDFLNIRTEAEELMNDFAEDVLQEISSTNPPNPLCTESPAAQKAPKSPSPKPLEVPKPLTPPPQPPKEPEVLPQIELNLPKRPVRDRLGARNETKTSETKVDRKKSKERRDSPERFTPEREPDFWGKGKSAKSRLGDLPETKKSSGNEDVAEHKVEPSTSRRLTSRVSVLESREARAGPASVVRVRPRPRPATNAPASNLLMRAVADANKSLRNIPPKVDAEPPKIKRALVLPMRRGVDAHKIVIQVQSERAPSSGGTSDCEIDFDTESLADLESEHDIRITKENRPTPGSEYIPKAITKKILNTNYVPSQRSDSGADVDETLIVETINNHKTSTKKDKEKGPTFVVTLDGLDPNIFLAKKLKTEGILDEETDLKAPKPIVDKPKDKEKSTSTVKQTDKEKEISPKKDSAKIALPTIEKKRLSDTSEDSDTQVILQATETNTNVVVEKRKSIEIPTPGSPPPAKKRRASPIVFDVKKKERERVRERTESTGSDNHVTIATTASTNKYDTLPSLPQAERKLLPCRAFPMCRFGGACAFAHPPCKFATGCTRRGCVYDHPAAAAAHTAPSVASQVVPVGNFKSITTSSIPNMCKFYPDCANPGCHYYHPKPCRYGKGCVNRLHCNFYHHDQPHKWRVS